MLFLGLLVGSAAHACTCMDAAEYSDSMVLQFEAVYLGSDNAYSAISANALNNENWSRDDHPLVFWCFEQSYRVERVIAGAVVVGDTVTLRSAISASCGYVPGELGTRHYITSDGEFVSMCGGSHQLGY